MFNKIAQNPFGTVPQPNSRIMQLTDIGLVLSAIMKTMIVAAGVYAVFNFILAGYAYISSSGDPKAIQMATAKIWQSVIGVTVAAGSFVIGSVVSQLVFGDPSTLLNIQIF